MDSWLDSNLNNCYSVEKILKTHNDGSYIELLRHKQNDGKVVRRHIMAPQNTDVYKRISRICSENLCRVYDVYENENSIDVLEEYVDGETLLSFAEKTMDIKSAKNALLQICKGLYALHKISIIHRDIKPSNIIISNGNAVIIDYGISRTYKADVDCDTTIFGTPGYAAPEQYGYAQTDPTSDIYAVGVLMNMLLTGVHPSKQIYSGSKAAKIIRKCIKTNSDERYQNIRDLSIDLLEL